MITNSKKYKSQFNKIKKAINIISLNHIQVYTYLMQCTYTITTSNNLKTCATDCLTKIWFNKSFLDKLTLSELIFVLMHETYHAILNHLYRKDDRDHLLWNAACDYYINDSLISDSIGTPIKDCLYDKAFHKMHSEKIYDILKKTSKNQTTPLQNFDEHGDISDLEQNSSSTGNIESYGPESDDNSNSSLEKTGSDKVQDLIEDLKGSLNKDASKAGPHSIIKEFLNTVEPETVSWDKILKGYIQSDKFKYTYNKINKRNYGNIIFQSTKNENDKTNVYLAIDVSSSVSISEIKRFCLEVYNICKTKSIENLHVIVFSHILLANHSLKVSNSFKSKLDSIFENMPIGGGTLFEVYDTFIKKKPNDYLIVFTDGYPCDGWGTDQKNLYFVITTDVKAPIGITIPFKLFS